jgi:hypothetical protein
MESFLSENGTVNLSANIDRICNAFETSFGIFECLHGVGHGLLAYLNYDLPETLATCNEFPDSFSRSSCAGGVFMENVVTGQGIGATGNVHDTQWVNQTDYHFPCNAIEPDYDTLFQCYQMQTSWMLTLSGYDFNTVAQECLNAPEHLISVCYKSFGRDAAGHTLRNPEKIIQLCNLLPDTTSYRNDCVVGALNVIIDFWGPALSNQASEFCALTIGKNKNICYQTLASRLSGIFTEIAKRDAICTTFEKEYQNLCSS